VRRAGALTTITMIDWRKDMDRGVVLIRMTAVAAGMALLSTLAVAQTPDLDAVKAANQAFYKALSSRDLEAMEGLWANKPYVVNLGPRSKSIAVGYSDAVTNYWPATFDTFSQISASASVSQLQSDGKIAWVIGTEKASLQPKSGGDAIVFETFVTNTFEKQGKRWLMTSHHAQPIPK
jgi:ketosteroid isomerase-like protein